MLMSEQVVKTSGNNGKWNTHLEQISRLELTHLITKLGNRAALKTATLKTSSSWWGWHTGRQGFCSHETGLTKHRLWHFSLRTMVTFNVRLRILDVIPFLTWLCKSTNAYTVCCKAVEFLWINRRAESTRDESRLGAAVICFGPSTAMQLAEAVLLSELRFSPSSHSTLAKKSYRKTHFSNWAELNGGNVIILMLYTWNCTMRQCCHGYSSCTAFSAPKCRYLYGYVETGIWGTNFAECWTCLPLGTEESSKVDICMKN